jgi:hypothetical protein
LVRMVEWHHVGGTLYCFLEYCNGGNLH